MKFDKSPISNEFCAPSQDEFVVATNNAMEAMDSLLVEPQHTAPETVELAEVISLKDWKEARDQKERIQKIVDESNADLAELKEQAKISELNELFPGVSTDDMYVMFESVRNCRNKGKMSHSHTFRYLKGLVLKDIREESKKVVYSEDLFALSNVYDRPQQKFSPDIVD